MIENFSCPLLFGEENLEFFTDTTSQSDLSVNSRHDTEEEIARKLQGSEWLGLYTSDVTLLGVTSQVHKNYVQQHLPMAWARL